MKCNWYGCGKMTDGDSIMCPHHALIHAESHLDDEAKALAAKNRREKKRAARVLLAESPLRADNPAFEKARPFKRIKPNQTLMEA